MSENENPVSDLEAREVLNRFIASHFRKPDRPHARFSIPVRLEYDDDVRMSQYITETEALRAALAEEKAAHGQMKQDYGDDVRKLEAALKDAEDNCRCPLCGCASQGDAESKECGCDGPVCSIELPETLAGAYVRVLAELAEEKAAREKAEGERDEARKLKRHAARFKGLRPGELPR